METDKIANGAVPITFKRIENSLVWAFDALNVSNLAFSIFDVGLSNAGKSTPIRLAIILDRLVQRALPIKNWNYRPRRAGFQQLPLYVARPAFYVGLEVWRCV